MFPRLNRFPLRAYLKDKPDFFANAHRLRGSFFMIFYQVANTKNGQPDDKGIAQAACIVSQKNFPRAVDRNKAKRQVRELISPLLKLALQNGQAGNIQLVVVVYRPIETEEQKEELQDRVETVLNNLPISNGRQ